MVTLEGLTNYDLTPYVELNRAFRRIIAAEVHGGEYAHVSASRTSKGMATGAISNYLAYVHFLSRPPDLVSTGNRHLSLGRLEVSVVLKAPFNNPTDYNSGLSVDFSSDSGCMRLCIGQNLGMFPEIHKPIAKTWQNAKTELAKYLNSGNYSLFAARVITLVEHSLKDFKIGASARVLEGRVLDRQLVF